MAIRLNYFHRSSEFTCASESELLGLVLVAFRPLIFMPWREVLALPAQFSTSASYGKMG
jgi:hypothetical protein